eukprot:765784-Hanusia_phi.AAC.5
MGGENDITVFIFHLLNSLLLNALLHLHHLLSSSLPPRPPRSPPKANSLIHTARQRPGQLRVRASLNNPAAQSILLPLFPSSCSSSPPPPTHACTIPVLMPGQDRSDTTVHDVNEGDGACKSMMSEKHRRGKARREGEGEGEGEDRTGEERRTKRGEERKGGEGRGGEATRRER